MRIVAGRIFAGMCITLLMMTGLLSQENKPNHTVTQADMDRWMAEQSNWGRWGKDDQKGTLNLITESKRKQAAALVKEGFAVSLAVDLNSEKAADNPDPYEITMRAPDNSSMSSRISLVAHGEYQTHLDSLGHVFPNGKMYNGYPAKDYVTIQGGVTKNSIINQKGGVFTRGILMDIPRLKGVPYLEPGTPIYVEDLEAWEKQAGVKVAAGDAVFIRTGRWVRRAKLGPWASGMQAAGLDASVSPWLKSRDVALIGSEDALSVRPAPPTNQVNVPGKNHVVHDFAIDALGLPIIDDCDLTALSEAAAARKRWEFLLTVAPLPIPNGTGSPVNPIALF
jgi:kynurenine formamidase